MLRGSLRLTGASTTWAVPGRALAAKSKSCAELGAVAEGCESATYCLGFGCLDVIVEVANRFGAPPGCLAAARDFDFSAEESETAFFVVLHDLGGHAGIGVLVPEPHHAPFDFQVILAVEIAEILGWVELLVCLWGGCRWRACRLRLSRLP